MAAIRNELEYINEMAKTQPEELIRKSELRYRGILEGVAENARRKHGHKLILLAGPSASGKTTTAQKIAQRLGEAGLQTFRVSLDDFYLPVEGIPLLPDGSRDIESIHALDLPLLHQTLRELMETGRGCLPRFDFASGKRAQGRQLKLGADDMIVLEGLHALHPLLCAQFGNTGVKPEQITRIYISVSSRIYDAKRQIVLNKRNLRLARRILRDMQFRNTGAAETLELWPAVTAGEEQYLSPCKPNADVRINSIHIYEPCVFRARLLPQLEAVSRSRPCFEEAARLARSLRRFEALPEALTPADSLLREFLG
ncbi:MAG: nucleoside kinase [Oscillospiraceae bacterium]|nr:nucleoside kinase [Oscillospiraceae bacterium]